MCTEEKWEKWGGCEAAGRVQLSGCSGRKRGNRFFLLDPGTSHGCRSYVCREFHIKKKNWLWTFIWMVFIWSQIYLSRLITLTPYYTMHGCNYFHLSELWTYADLQSVHKKVKRAWFVFKYIFFLSGKADTIRLMSFIHPGQSQGAEPFCPSPPLMSKLQRTDGVEMWLAATQGQIWWISRHYIRGLSYFTYSMS